jgi:hypothetical protein
MKTFGGQAATIMDHRTIDATIGEWPISANHPTLTRRKYYLPVRVLVIPVRVLELPIRVLDPIRVLGSEKIPIRVLELPIRVYGSEIAKPIRAQSVYAYTDCARIGTPWVPIREQSVYAHSEGKKGSEGGKGGTKGSKGSKDGSMGGNKGKGDAKSSSKDDMGSKNKSKSDSKGNEGSKGGGKGKGGAKSSSDDDKGSKDKSKGWCLASRVISKVRSSLSPENASQIVFVNGALDWFDQQTVIEIND